MDSLHTALGRNMVRSTAGVESLEEKSGVIGQYTKMKANCFCGLVLLAFSLTIWGQEKSQPSSASSTTQTTLAMTPPMGWNSWDGYGTTINEDEFKANSDWFAKHLKPSGWEYVTI